MFARLIIFEIIWWPDDFQNVKTDVLCWPITDKSVSRRWELLKAQERGTEEEAKVVAKPKSCWQFDVLHKWEIRTAVIVYIAVTNQCTNNSNYFSSK